MQNEPLTRAIERLIVDECFLARFRRDPERALRPYRLTPDEREAVKSGETGKLAALGADVARLHPRHHWSFEQLLVAVATCAPRLGTAVLALGIALAPAALVASRSSVARAQMRTRQRSAVRVERAFAVRRSGVRIQALRREGVRAFALRRQRVALRSREGGLARSAALLQAALPIDLLTGERA